MEGAEPSAKRSKVSTSSSTSSTSAKMNETHQAAFDEHGLKDAEDAPVEIEKIEPLDAHTRARYVDGARRCPGNLEQLSVLESSDVSAYKVTSAAASSSGAASMDYVAIVDPATGKPVMVACDDGVSYDTLSPLQVCTVKEKEEKEVCGKPAVRKQCRHCYPPI